MQLKGGSTAICLCGIQLPHSEFAPLFLLMAQGEVPTFANSGFTLILEDPALPLCLPNFGTVFKAHSV